MATMSPHARFILWLATWALILGVAFGDQIAGALTKEDPAPAPSGWWGAGGDEGRTHGLGQWMSTWLRARASAPRPAAPPPMMAPWPQPEIPPATDECTDTGRRGGAPQSTTLEPTAVGDWVWAAGAIYTPLLYFGACTLEYAALPWLLVGFFIDVPLRCGE
jgi:hypothetical protein